MCIRDRYLAAERPGSGIERSELRTERRRRRESGFGGLWAMGGARGVARESGFDGLWTMGGPRKVARESRRRRREGREEREAGASLVRVVCLFVLGEGKGVGVGAGRGGEGGGGEGERRKGGGGGGGGGGGDGGGGRRRRRKKTASSLSASPFFLPTFLCFSLREEAPPYSHVKTNGRGSNRSERTTASSEFSFE